MSVRARIFMLVLLTTLVPAMVMAIYEFDRLVNWIGQAERRLQSLVNNATDTLLGKARGTVQLLHGSSYSPELEPSKHGCSKFIAAVL